MSFHPILAPRRRERKHSYYTFISLKIQVSILIYRNTPMNQIECVGMEGERTNKALEISFIKPAVQLSFSCCVTWSSLLLNFFIQDQFNSFRRRANARNVSFRISLRWTIHIINSVDETKLSQFLIDYFQIV